jgi:hypothetical protein
LRYAYTVDGDVEFLEWALRTRRGAGITYFPNHAVNLVHLDHQWAGVLDNNRVDQIIWIPRADFLARWKAYGGWAWTLVYDPPPPVPYLNVSAPTGQYSTAQRETLGTVECHHRPHPPCADGEEVGQLSRDGRDILRRPHPACLDGEAVLTATAEELIHHPHQADGVCARGAQWRFSLTNSFTIQASWMGSIPNCFRLDH